MLIKPFHIALETLQWALAILFTYGWALHHFGMDLSLVLGLHLGVGLFIACKWPIYTPPECES